MPKSMEYGNGEYDPRSASLRAIRSAYRRKAAGKRFSGIPKFKKSASDRSGSPQDGKTKAARPYSMNESKGKGAGKKMDTGMSYTSRTDSYAADGQKTSKKKATKGYKSFRQIVRETVTGKKPKKLKPTPKSMTPTK
jgi:hypothetical protein